MWITRALFKRPPIPAKSAKAEARDSKKKFTTSAKRAIPQASALKAKNEERKRKRRQLQRDGQRIVKLGKRSLASRWRIISRRLEVRSAGGGQAIWKHPVSFEGEGKRRRPRRRREDQKALEARPARARDFRSGRRRIRR